MFLCDYVLTTTTTQGSLYCVGSSMFLKKQFGIGYHMTIVKQDSFSTEIFSNFVTSYIAGTSTPSNIPSNPSLATHPSNPPYITLLFSRKQGVSWCPLFKSSSSTWKKFFVDKTIKRTAMYNGDHYHLGILGNHVFKKVTLALTRRDTNAIYIY